MAQATSSKRARAALNIHHTSSTTHPHRPTKKHAQAKKLPSTHSPLPKPRPAQAQPNARSRKHPRPHAMPTFAVPADDADSFVSEQDMAMEVDGDSFEEQTDDLSRMRSGPTWQAQAAGDAQHQQPSSQAQHQAAQGRAQLARPSTHQQHSFRPAQPSRARARYIPRTRDQHVPDAEVPSSTGKRKRRESQPPARDTYHSDPDTPCRPALRRIGGMVVVMSITAFSWMAGAVSSAWASLRGQKAPAAAEDAWEQEILAVEMGLSGRKRRAVPSGSFRVASEPHASQASQSPSSQISKSPSSQTSDSPTSPAEEGTAKALAPPGAFPTPSLPSPEQSLSPKLEQLQPQPKREADPRKDWNEMPNLREYSPTRNGVVYSMEPTRGEMRERFKDQHAVSPEDYETLVQEKQEERRLRDDAEYNTWAYRQDRRKQKEEVEFWVNEHDSEDTVRMDAKRAAAKVKFPEGKSDEEAYIHDLDHAINHGKAECCQNGTFQKLHEYHGLQAHNYAKVIEAEVAQDVEALNKKKLSPEEGRAFQRTSAHQKLNIKKVRPSPERPTETAKRPRPVAAARRVNGGGPAGAIEEETSRPTTASSHKPATYKGGLEPTPKKDAPGANIRQPWSYDQTMLPGKSLLKSKNQNELKDRRIDALIDRSKKLVVQSPPKEQRVQNYLQHRRDRRRDHWLGHVDHEQNLKLQTRTNRTQEKANAEQTLETIRAQWEEMRLEEAKQKQEEEEEAAHLAAEELAKQKALEDELARKAAEEDEKAAHEAAEAQATHDRKQILIRPLDPEWADRVQRTVDITNKDTVVAQSLDGTELTRHDFKSLLDHGGWLNDEIVNAFISAIVARKQEQAGYKRGANSVPPYEAYNTAWWTTYKKAGNKITSLQRWSKRKGIQGERLLRAEKIFLPINTAGHWMLLVISPQEKKMEFLDSLRRNATVYFKAAREWLEMELGPTLYRAGEWTESSASSNMQTNSDDCGVFVAMNSLATAKGYPLTEVSAAKMPEARMMVAAVLLNGGLRGDWDL